MTNLREPSAEFLKQYDNAKELAESAISDGKNVIIFGKGANGKTHLARELELDVLRNNYKIYLGGRKYRNPPSCNIKTWIETPDAQDAEITQDYFDQNNIDSVLIYMNISLH